LAAGTQEEKNARSLTATQLRLLGCHLLLESLNQPALMLNLRLLLREHLLSLLICYFLILKPIADGKAAEPSQRAAYSRSSAWRTHRGTDDRARGGAERTTHQGSLLTRAQGLTRATT
jgi:hypothetical protein